jgi:predicted unusual protein kinase regulating ubiquinone biosynthesis (AarF/ABC1/UbiB family)
VVIFDRFLSQLLRHGAFWYVCLVLVFQSLVVRAETPALYLSFEQRLAASYALAVYEKDPVEQEKIIAHLKAYSVKQRKLPKETLTVKNFPTFLKHFRGEWPSTESLELDLKFVEEKGPRALVTYKSDSPRVQRQIDDYLDYQSKTLIALFKEKNPSNQELTVANGLALLKSAQESGNTREVLSQWALKEVSGLISEQMKEINNMGAQIAQNQLAGQSDPTMRIFLQTMFQEYFSRLSLESKLLIVSGYLGGNLQVDEAGKLELMIQNSGPQLQKLLQVVARQSELPPALLEVFQKLESSVRPVPWVQVKQILEQEKQNYVFKSFERKPIGVGTMAQVHRAKLVLDNQERDVVVRFIKPNIERRVNEDHRILLEVADVLDANQEFRNTGVPRLKPLIEDITQTVKAELSQEDTIQRQRLAKKVYEKKSFVDAASYKNELEFHVPSIVKPRRASQLMVQEMIFGSKFEKAVKYYTDLAPDLKRILAEEIAKVWAYEVTFGSGFYHSDLHQGNFMVDITDAKIVVNILDFGMGGTITADMQRKVMLLGVGMELLDTEYLSRAFWQLSDKAKSTVNQKQLKSLIRAKIATLNGDPSMGMEQWTAFVMEQGLVLPYDFVSLNRGIVIINSLLQEAGSEMTLTEVVKSLAKRSPLKVYRNLVTDENVRKRDLMKLGWLEFTGMLSPDGMSVPIKPNLPGQFCRSVLLAR